MTFQREARQPAADASEFVLEFRRRLRAFGQAGPSLAFGG